MYFLETFFEIKTKNPNQISPKNQFFLNFYLRGYPADVWGVGNNDRGAYWLAEKNGVEKTKAEAQALVTAEVEAGQAAPDPLSDEEKAESPNNTRPSDITLP